MPDRRDSTLLVVGVSHHTADADRRGQLALTPAGVRAFLHAARAHAHGVLGEVLVLSTCNRVEFYVATSGTDTAERALRVLVEDATGVDSLSAGDHRYRYESERACRHLTRVACGLDSMIVGEAEILGQLRAAAAASREAGTLGPRLERVVAAAQRAGGRTRSETAIGIGATSVATAAVALGERVLRGLAGKRVVIVGAGHAGRLALSRVLKRRAGAVTVVNRTLARAEAAVSQTTARARPLEALPEVLADADLVIVAAQGPHWMISAETIAAAGRDLHAWAGAGPDGRPSQAPSQRLVIVDIAMPAAVEPSVGAAANVRVFGIDELRGVVEETQRRRLAAVPQAEAIAADEAARAWRQWLRREAVRPLAPSQRGAVDGVPVARGDGAGVSAGDPTRP